ncbi:hypothetical protein [Sphingomonas oligophenolica]|uniref:Cytochrome c n=1 Tax=Sphingomonas oligophenolica TaxID=301154 RepID=A0A502BT26_9SPHN|nr:hypothetical protein [Sphingomonas oligophenolica]TPG03988.1 hypothetical protein EAH84_15645 [Sphingomonas oligophenolica]
MKTPSFGTLIVIIFGAVIVALLAVGAPNSRPAPQQVATNSLPPEPTSVSGPGLTLASVNVELHDDTATYPDGPHADVINANCTACHSASMALYQPPLSADAWHKEVEKMRETFKAPVAEKDVPAIVAYLTAMSAKTAAAGTASKPDAAP